MAQRSYFFRKTSPALNVEVQTDTFGDDIVTFTVTDLINLTDEAVAEGLDLKYKPYAEAEFKTIATDSGCQLVRYDGTDEDELVAEA